MKLAIQCKTRERKEHSNVMFFFFPELKGQEETNVQARPAFCKGQPTKSRGQTGPVSSCSPADKRCWVTPCINLPAGQGPSRQPTQNTGSTKIEKKSKRMCHSHSKTFVCIQKSGQAAMSASKRDSGGTETSRRSTACVSCAAQS